MNPAFFFQHDLIARFCHRQTIQAQTAGGKVFSYIRFPHKRTKIEPFTEMISLYRFSKVSEINTA